VTFPTVRKIWEVSLFLPPTRAGGTTTDKRNLFEFQLECYENKRWRKVHHHKFQWPHKKMHKNHQPFHEQKWRRIHLAPKTLKVGDFTNACSSAAWRIRDIKPMYAAEVSHVKVFELKLEEEEVKEVPAKETDVPKSDLAPTVFTTTYAATLIKAKSAVVPRFSCAEHYNHPHLGESTCDAVDDKDTNSAGMTCSTLSPP